MITLNNADGVKYATQKKEAAAAKLKEAQQALDKARQPRFKTSFFGKTVTIETDPFAYIGEAIEVSVREDEFNKWNRTLKILTDYPESSYSIDI